MLIVGGNQSAAGGYNVDNGLRFNDGSNDNIARTPSSASDRRTWTLSFWIKRGVISTGTVQTVFGVNNGVSDSTNFEINFDGSTDRLQVLLWNVFIFKTDARFRDPSAWMHVVFALDTTQGTSSNRAKLYVNGVQVTDFNTTNYPSLNAQYVVNNTASHRFGLINYVSAGGLNRPFDGYLSEITFIDGQQLDPTSFGEFDEDSGIWKPIDVSGFTFGTNGYYLQFQDSSALGDDTSGNSNDFTVNNLTSIDQTTDTCTNNFSVISPIIPSYKGAGVAKATFSQANLNLATNSSYFYQYGSLQVSQGKWYWEGKAVSLSGSDSSTGFGFMDMENLYNPSASYPASNVYIYGNNGNSRDPTNGSQSYGASYTTGDIIGIAMDLDNGYGYFSKNGTWQNSGDPESGATGTGAAFSLNPAATGQFFAAYVADNSTLTTVDFALNFGSPPYTISSGNSDADGYGNFEYAVPSGYYALNTKNLAEYG